MGYSIQQFSTNLWSKMTPRLRVSMLLVFVLAMVSELVRGRLHCGRGEIFVPGTREHPSHCRPCKPGFFQNDFHHRHRQCERCQVFNNYDPREILVRECTRFQDIRIGCVPGFYWKDGDCRACTNCTNSGKVQTEPCRKHKDTVCREKDGGDEKEIICLGGFYLKDGDCHACTNCTFLGKIQHKPCQKHHDAFCLVKRYDDSDDGHTSSQCPTGFFFDDRICRRCTDCTLIGKTEAKPCDLNQDSICQEIQDIG